MRQLAFMASISDLDMTLVILLDTGCSQHTFAAQHYFSDLRMFKPHEMTRKIQGIGGTIFQPIGIGTVSLQVAIKSQPHTLILSNTLYCPSLQSNLISSSQLLDKDVKIVLKKNGAVVKGPKKNVICEIHH
jgi:hypothetical protein